MVQLVWTEVEAGFEQCKFSLGERLFDLRIITEPSKDPSFEVVCQYGSKEWSNRMTLIESDWEYIPATYDDYAKAKSDIEALMDSILTGHEKMQLAKYWSGL